MKILEHKENPFPDDLEGRLNAILNVVNSELKTATLLHLDDTPVGGEEIKRRVRETVGQSYLPYPPAFIDYCRYSLFPIGMVAKQVVLYEDDSTINIGYKLTESGRKYGLPIAAFTLDYVLKNNRSLFTVLGSTASNSSNRCPLTRIKILEKLKQGKIRSVDLLDSIGYSSSNSTHNLMQLKKIGFIEFQSVGEEVFDKPIKGYFWMGKDLTKICSVCNSSKLTKETAKLMEELKESDSFTISRKLNCNMRIISEILNGLGQQGFVQSVGKWEKEKRSEVTLCDTGRRFLEDYIDKIKDSLNDGPLLKEMMEFYEQLRGSKNRFGETVGRAINLYSSISPHIHRKPLEETEEKILKYLRTNPGKRPTEISEYFSLTSPSSYLSPLFKSGKLRKERGRGKVVRYYVN